MTELFAHPITWTAFLIAAMAFYILTLKSKRFAVCEGFARAESIMPAVLLAAAGLLFVIFSYYRLPTTDAAWYMSWGRAVNKFGFGNFYGNAEAMEEVLHGIANYPPFYMYALSLCDHIVNLLRLDYVLHPRACAVIYTLPGIAAHLTGGLLIYRLAKRQGGGNFALFVSSLFLLAPHMLYNTATWGQTDEMFALIAMVSLYALTRGKPSIACVLFGLLIAFKPQSIFFAPLYLYWALDRKDGRFVRLRYLAIGPAVALATAVVVSFPFLRTLNPMALAEFYLEPQKGSFSIYAANIYGLFFYRIPPTPLSRAVLLYGGYAVSAAAAGVLYFLRRGQNESIRMVQAASILVPTCFMILPSMHERYLFPALFPMIFAFALTGSRLYFRAYMLFGLCSFANMFVVLNGRLFGSVNYGDTTWITAFRLTAALTLCVYIWYVRQEFCCRKIAENSEAADNRD